MQDTSTDIFFFQRFGAGICGARSGGACARQTGAVPSGPSRVDWPCSSGVWEEVVPTQLLLFAHPVPLHSQLDVNDRELLHHYRTFSSSPYVIIVIQSHSHLFSFHLRPHPIPTPHRPFSFLLQKCSDLDLRQSHSNVAGRKETLHVPCSKFPMSKWTLSAHIQYTTINPIIKSPFFSPPTFIVPCRPTYIIFILLIYHPTLQHHPRRPQTHTHTIFLSSFCLSN